MKTLEELCTTIVNPDFCFILGSGPSLALQKIDFNNHFTIAVNGGYLRYEADIFCSDDEDVFYWSYLYDNLKKSHKTKVLLFEDKYIKHNLFNLCNKWFNERMYWFKHSTTFDFTTEYNHINNGVCRSRSSVGSAINIAYLLGFRKVILMGIDGIYYQGKRHFYEFPGWEKPKRSKPFFQKRFPRKQEENQTDQDLIDINSYWNDFYEKSKKFIEIYNGSEISTIKVFPKINLLCPNQF